MERGYSGEQIREKWKSFQEEENEPAGLRMRRGSGPDSEDRALEKEFRAMGPSGVVGTAARHNKEDQVKRSVRKPLTTSLRTTVDRQSRCNHQIPCQRKMVESMQQGEAGTLLSSFFMVTRSRDFRECPVGVMK
jgi:hypothetical protein